MGLMSYYRRKRYKNIKKNLYQKFIEKSLPLTDQLAAARSILANERTFLSYQRMALTLAIAGFSFIKFSNMLVFELLGYLFLPAAVITILLGMLRYSKMRDLIRNSEIESYEKLEEQEKKDDPMVCLYRKAYYDREDQSHN